MTDNKNPEGVRGMSWEQIDNLGVNEATGELYWRGRPVEVRKPLILSSWQKFVAFLVAAFTIMGGLGAVAQGWVAYNDWACKVHWWAVVCPK